MGLAGSPPKDIVSVYYGRALYHRSVVLLEDLLRSQDSFPWRIGVTLKKTQRPPWWAGRGRGQAEPLAQPQDWHFQCWVVMHQRQGSHWVLSHVSEYFAWAQRSAKLMRIKSEEAGMMMPCWPLIV